MFGDNKVYLFNPHKILPILPFKVSTEPFKYSVTKFSLVPGHFQGKTNGGRQPPAKHELTAHTQ